MTTQIYIEINELGVPTAMVIEKMVGETKVYHRVLPETPGGDIEDQVPEEALYTIDWAVDRFEMKVEEHRSKVLSELYGLPVEKVEEAKAALEVLKRKG